MTVHGLLLYAHLLLFVFWLGADLGVFLCSRAVVQPGLTVDQRLRTAQLMGAIDLAPRIAASLMLTVGGILTEYVGITHPWWQMAGIVLLGPVWLTLVLIGYWRDGTALGYTVARLDEAFRAVLAIVVPVSVAYSWFTGRLDPAPYVAGKLLLFAAIMFLGLLLRRGLRPMTAGLRSLAAHGSSKAVEDAMARSHARTRPLVVAIWIGLALAALIGVSKPGAPPETKNAPAVPVVSPATGPVLGPRLP